MTTNTPKVPYSVATVAWETHARELQLVREQVFIVEQDVPLDEEWDGRDETAWHVLAVDAEGNPVGTARVLDSGQIGRMAVLKSLRGSGLGAALLQEAMRCAEQQGLSGIFLHAQTHAIPFYEKQGFTAEGEVFMDADIPHRNMVLANAI